MEKRTLRQRAVPCGVAFQEEKPGYNPPFGGSEGEQVFVGAQHFICGRWTRTYLCNVWEDLHRSPTKVVWNGKFFAFRQSALEKCRLKKVYRAWFPWRGRQMCLWQKMERETAHHRRRFGEKQGIRRDKRNPNLATNSKSSTDWRIFSKLLITISWQEHFLLNGTKASDAQKQTHWRTYTSTLALSRSRYV